MTELTNIASLDELVSNPETVFTLPQDVAQQLLVKVVSLQVLLVQRSLMPTSTQTAGSSETFITVDEAVTKFGVTKRWLYRHKKQLPYSQPSRKVLVFPEQKLRSWFANHKTG